MYRKLFTILFFDRVSFIFLFLLLVSTPTYLILKQVSVMTVESPSIDVPDIEITGGIEGEKDSEAVYGGIDNLVTQLEALHHDTEMYRMVMRNLYTFSSPFYQVSFRIYGTEKQFLNRKKKQLAYGTVPSQGRKEILAGYNAATFYKLEVGDVINEEMGFNLREGQDEYIVSGILSEDDKYFGDGFFLLKEDFPYSETNTQDNVIMIYTSGKQSYKDISDDIDKLKSEFVNEKYVDNYKKNNRGQRQDVKQHLLILGVSFILLELLYLYISKGMEKKAGIVKALGIPDRLILAICSLGFLALTILSSVVALVLSLLFLNIKQELLILLIPAIDFPIFLFLFFKVSFLYKRISPSKSMVAK